MGGDIHNPYFFVFQYTIKRMFNVEELDKKKMKNKYNKDALGFWSAIVAFSIGWILTICGFISPPLGEISNSVLYVLGQSLIYTASVIGIGQYFNSEMRHFKREMHRYVDEEERKRYNHSDIDIDRLDNSLDDSVEEET